MIQVKIVVEVSGPGPNDGHGPRLVETAERVWDGMETLMVDAEENAVRAADLLVRYVVRKWEGIARRTNLVKSKEGR